MRILCVDDDPTAVDIYLNGLHQTFPEDVVQAAASGEEAVEKIRETGPYDVVLTDLQMPGLDGLDVLRAAKEADPRTEVVVVTGMASIDTAVDAMRQGARDYLEKPINISLLQEKLENIRDYVFRAAESEEYRRAHEETEARAGAEIHRLEARVDAYRSAVAGALERFAAGDAEAAAAILRRAGEPSSTGGAGA